MCIYFYTDSLFNFVKTDLTLDSIDLLKIGKKASLNIFAKQIFA